MQFVVRRSFLSHGWLLPTLLPITHAAGRAVFLILAGIYVLWGLAALYRTPVRLNRVLYAAIILLLLLLCTRLPGAWYAQDSWRAFDKWLSFTYLTMVFPITLIVLCHGQEQDQQKRLQRLTRMLGLAGFITILALYIRLPFDFSAPDFAAEFYLREDNLPWLLPFMLAWAASMEQRYRCSLWLLILVTVLAYILMSDGRSALLGVTVCLALYALIGLGWKLSWASLCAGGLLTLGLIAQGGRFVRIAFEQGDLNSVLMAATSFRSLLWQRAIAYPPDNIWWGIGMGNMRYETEIVTVGELHLGHLHNFLLDAWYETGILGLATLLLFIAFPLLRLARCWVHLSIAEHQLAGIYLAAVAAILAAAMFSFSYNSKQFAMYLPLLLAVLLFLAESAVSDVKSSHS